MNAKRVARELERLQAEGYRANDPATIAEAYLRASESGFERKLTRDEEDHWLDLFQAAWEFHHAIDQVLRGRAWPTANSDGVLDFKQRKRRK